MTTHYVSEIKGLKTRGRFKPLILYYYQYIRCSWPYNWLRDGVSFCKFRESNELGRLMITIIPGESCVF